MLLSDFWDLVSYFAGLPLLILIIIYWNPAPILQKIAIKRIIFSIIFSVVLLLFAFLPLFPTLFQINICGTDTIENCAIGFGWFSLITLPIGLTLGNLFRGSHDYRIFSIDFWLENCQKLRTNQIKALLLLFAIRKIPQKNLMFEVFFIAKICIIRVQDIHRYELAKRIRQYVIRES